MKLLTYALPDAPQAEHVGIYIPEKDAILPAAAAGQKAADMNEWIVLLQDPALFSKLLGTIERVQGRSDAPADEHLISSLIPYSKVIRKAPIPHPLQDIMCLGINYAAHAEESARYKREAFERNREYAVYFAKRVDEAVADGQDIPSHSGLTSRLDYEVELAVILGRDAKNVAAADAMDYVFGYTILNDVSARDLQTRHKQWYFGKSLDGFCPMGPWIVTKDEMDPVQGIRSFINGELRQNSTTALLMFDIPQIIEELSSGMTLKAGSIISTGTPSGVGMGFDPPRFLVSGDIVRCEIDGIGSLTNTVR